MTEDLPTPETETVYDEAVVHIEASVPITYERTDDEQLMLKAAVFKLLKKHVTEYNIEQQTDS